jgi:hypothetical protein
MRQPRQTLGLEPAECHQKRRPIHRSTYCVGDSFDEIGHVAVMDRVRRRIKDKRLGSLVKAFLKAGVLTDLGDREESLTGTPQGGIFTPPTQWGTSASR